MVDREALLAFFEFLHENMPNVYPSGVEGAKWSYLGMSEAVELEFWWDLGWGESGPSGRLRLRLRGDGLYASFFGTSDAVSKDAYSRLPRQSIRVPVKWELEDFNAAQVRFFEAFDGIISIFEHKAFKTKLSANVQRVPISQLFRERKPEPRKPAQAALSLEQAIAAKDEQAVVAAARKRLTSDQILDIYNLAKELKSNRLMNLVRAARTESQLNVLVSHLLD